jgi:hypothetical protein
MRNKSVIPFLVLFIAASLVLLLYSYLGMYTRLMSDDYCSIYDARRFSLLRYIWYWYITWGGRYSAISTDYILKGIGTNGLRFVPFAVLLIWTAVTVFTSRMLLKKEKMEWQGMLPSISIGAVVVLAILLISPEPEQVLYWWNGMRTYVLALISFTFHIALLYWVAARGNDQRLLIPGSVSSFFLALFTGGFNESFTTVQFSFFTGITILAILIGRLRIKDSSAILLYTAIAGSAAALIIMMASPGAANRQTYFPPPPGIMRMFEITIKGYANYLFDILSDPTNVLALTGVAGISVWIGMGSEDKSTSGWLAGASLVAGLFLGFVSLLPVVYGTSEMPAVRTFMVPSFVLVISLIYAGLMTGKWLRKFSDRAFFAFIWPVLMICSLSGFLLSTFMASKTIHSRKAEYAGFAQRWDRMNAQIIQAKVNGDESVLIAAPKNWAGRAEPNIRPKFWVTACYSNYYGIQVLGPDPDKPHR